MKWISLIFVTALAVASFYYGRSVGRQYVTLAEVERDTIVVRDTVRDTLPVPVDRWRTRVRVDTVYFACVDTVTTCDTVRVEVPIERVEYRTDRYYAIVEGWRPTLAYIETYDAQTIITERQRVESSKRWGITLGVQAGYGITPKGMQPYAGGGVTFGYTF